VSKLSRRIVDNRRYEQVQANAGAAIYEEVISERDYRYDCLTTYSWAKRFSEPFLDFGCGTGVASEVFERLGKQVVAFDASREMLRFAKRRCNVPLVLADALNLPFRDKVFSTTCVVGVLHHILNLDGAFSEIARCTEEVVCMNEPCPKPSVVMRVILLAVYCVQVFQRKTRFRRKGSVVKGEYKSKYERPLDPRMLIQLANKNGFELAQLRYFNHIPLLHEFLSEKSRIRLFSALISAKNGTDAEIVFVSSHLLHGGGRQ
jgi:ubiquinone/menaquinone biosynthesis C-methylase UbiE